MRLMVSRSSFRKKIRLSVMETASAMRKDHQIASRLILDRSHAAGRSTISWRHRLSWLGWSNWLIDIVVVHRAPYFAVIKLPI